MEDVLSLVYANRHAYGLPHEEVATGRLLSKKHAQELRNYKLLSDYYYGHEWRVLSKQRRTGFFIRGVNKKGEYCYLTGVKDGMGICDNFSLFYAATTQTVNKYTVHGTAFNAVDGYYFARDVHASYKEDGGNLLNEPQYILNRDNSFDSYAKADIVEPDVFSKLQLTYNRCEKYGISRSVGLQYVLDGLELINQTANDLTRAAYAVTQALVADIDVEDLQEYIESPKGEYPDQRVKDVLREVMALLRRK